MEPTLIVLNTTTDPNVGTIVSALVASHTAIIVACISAAVAVLSSIASVASALRTTKLKGEVDIKLEGLKADLGHKQLISSSQWAAEFDSYKELWKAVVPVRTIAHKLVNRNKELASMGITEENLTPQAVQKLVWEFPLVIRAATFAINENAPFYPIDIRKKANEIPAISGELLIVILAEDVAKRENAASPAGENTKRNHLQALMTVIDQLESLIRNRLEEVKII
jgi:hypothetical protein